MQFVASKENSQEFFSQSINSDQAELNGISYLDKFMEGWEKYYDFKKSADEKDAEDILSKMIHSIETDKKLTQSDNERLNHICWDIEFSLDPMRSAFIDLTK